MSKWFSSWEVDDLSRLDWLRDSSNDWRLERMNEWMSEWVINGFIDRPKKGKMKNG